MARAGDERQFVGNRDNGAIADEIVRGLDTRVVAENLAVKLSSQYSCATIRQENTGCTGAVSVRSSFSRNPI